LDVKWLLATTVEPEDGPQHRRRAGNLKKSAPKTPRRTGFHGFLKTTDNATLSVIM
jgi:hypothetical protein